jgi:hypothetical protein
MTTAGCRDRGKHTSAFWIDFLDAILGDLKKMLAIKRGSRVRGNVDGACGISTRGIERIQLVPGREPDLLPVIGDSMHAVGASKGTVLAYNFGC